MRGNTSYQKTDFGCEAPELLSKFVPKKTEIAGIDLKSDISANDLRTALKIDKVDNTSDKDKPIPDAVKIVLNKKISYYSISDFAMPDTYYRLPFEVGEYFILKNDGTEDISKLLYGYNESWYNPSAYYWFSNTIKAGNTALCYMKQAVVDAGDVDGHDGEVVVYELNENFAQILQNKIDIASNKKQIAANESRIDAITLEIVDDNHIGNDGTTEVMLPGKILQLNNRDDFSVSTELKIRYEINYENLYPDAIDAKSQTDLTSTESIYWMYVSSQQTGDNFGPDDDYYNFDTVITEAGKMYFKVISFAQHAVDGNIPGEIQVLAVVPPIPTTEAYIRTAKTEDWTRLTNENELNATKSDVAVLQQQVGALDSTLAILKDNLGTMSDMLDLLNGVTEEST